MATNLNIKARVTFATLKSSKTSIAVVVILIVVVSLLGVASNLNINSIGWTHRLTLKQQEHGRHLGFLNRKSTNGAC